MNSHNEMHPHRPVRRPGTTEARLTLARDLARGLWGVNEKKAMRLLHLPLMEVALEGAEGIATAQAQEWRRAA